MCIRDSTWLHRIWSISLYISSENLSKSFSKWSKKWKEFVVSVSAGLVEEEVERWLQRVKPQNQETHLRLGVKHVVVWVVPFLCSLSVLMEPLVWIWQSKKIKCCLNHMSVSVLDISYAVLAVDSEHRLHLHLEEAGHTLNHLSRGWLLIVVLFVQPFSCKFHLLIWEEGGGNLEIVGGCIELLSHCQSAPSSVITTTSFQWVHTRRA